MASWKEMLSHTVIEMEERYDLLKYRLRERLGGRDPLQILPYRGFGTQEALYLKGRVLEDKGIKAASERDSLWDNLVNMYKRFNSKEIPYARVSGAYQDVEQRVVTDEEGFLRRGWRKSLRGFFRRLVMMFVAVSLVQVEQAPKRQILQYRQKKTHIFL